MNLLLGVGYSAIVILALNFGEQVMLFRINTYKMCGKRDFNYL